MPMRWNADSNTAADRDRLRPESAGYTFPTEMLLLFIGPEEPSWTLLTLQLDRYGCERPRFQWCSSLAEAARIVNQERFDCIVVDDSTPAADDRTTSEDGQLLDRLSALRTGGCLDPLLVLSDRVDDDWLARMADMDGEILTTRQGWRSAALVPWIRCTIERRTLAREHHEIGVQGREKREQESSEVTQILQQRHDLVSRMRSEQIPTVAAPTISEETSELYLGLLRSAVLASAVEMSAEVDSMTTQLARQGLSGVDVLALHTDAVEQLIQGLGHRSARSVLQRTDLLGIEVLVRLGGMNTGLQAFRTVRDLGLDLSQGG